MHDKADIALVWESLREGLRKLRGSNRFRGNEEHLIHKLEIWLFQESRGGHLATSYYTLHITAQHQDLHATHHPGGEKIAVADFGGDWEAWLAAIVDRCRGAAYLKSNSATADYRRPFAATEQ